MAIKIPLLYDGLIQLKGKFQVTNLGGKKLLTPIRNVLNRPLKVPFRQDTIDRYLHCMGLLVVFAIRVTDPKMTFQLNPSSSVLLKCNALRTKIQRRTVANNDDELQDAIHELILALLSPRQLENSDCIGSAFIIFNTYPSSNRPLSYESINTVLTSLKWPFRASSFSEIRCKIKEKARNMGRELTNGYGYLNSRTLNGELT